MAFWNSDKKEREFNVLIGFDVEAGRWDIGDPLKESDITPENVEALLEMNAIEVAEVTNGNS